MDSSVQRNIHFVHVQLSLPKVNVYCVCKYSNVAICKCRAYGVLTN